MRVPEPIKPYVVKLIRLYRLKEAEAAIRAINTAEKLEDAIGAIDAAVLPAKKKHAS